MTDLNDVRQVYDYIVVGGGTAGCVLASRLSEDPATEVLLLEAGGRETELPAMAIPAAWLTLLETVANWGDVAVNGFTHAPLATPRGRGLGGSSNINGLNFLRGHRWGYDAWLAHGAHGWGYDDLLPYFRRSETAAGRDPAVRGVSGPLAVSPPPDPNPLVEAMVAAAVEAGFGRATDISNGQEAGFGWPDNNIANGVRQSAVDAYLTPVLGRSNLHIITGATAHRLSIDGGSCRGVEYRTRRGDTAVSSAAEVILAAGTIGSAQLLLVSGVGPSDHLRAVGVEPQVDLPGVGANLVDHPFATVTYQSTQQIPTIDANPIGEAMGFVRSDPSLVAPDLQFVLISHPIPVRTLPQPEHGYSIAFSIMYPRSRGYVRLASPDIGDLPVVDPNYLNDPRDVAGMRDGLRTARRIGDSDALRSWRAEEIHPGGAVADDDALAIDDYLRLSLRCYFHYVGTAKIGTDSMAVVDENLRVHGLTGLRVADASVMPTIIGANTNATVYAIAERAADLVRATGPHDDYNGAR